MNELSIQFCLSQGHNIRYTPFSYFFPNPHLLISSPPHEVWVLYDIFHEVFGLGLGILFSHERFYDTIMGIPQWIGGIIWAEHEGIWNIYW